MSFWEGYIAGVSQNVVAALLFGPWIISRMKKHLTIHHDRIKELIKETQPVPMNVRKLPTRGKNN